MRRTRIRCAGNLSHSLSRHTTFSSSGRPDLTEILTGVNATMKGAILGIGLVGLLSACDRGRSQDAPDFTPGPTPLEFIAGESMYQASCGSCHGPQGTGTVQGPPLVHEIYQPSHHADASFYRAVQLGVAPHHWRYGPMPPVAGLPPEQVQHIVGYVRWLQRQAGIS